jgi:glycine/D-amino acid oxidase-like deaminating enzyme
MKLVNYHKGFNEVVTNEKLKIKAKKIIYCIGYESKSLIKEDFVKLKSTFAIVSERDETKLKHLHKTLFWNTAEPYIYLRTTDDGRLLVGGGDEDFRDPEKRDRLLAKKEREILRNLKIYFSNMSFIPTLPGREPLARPRMGYRTSGSITILKIRISYWVLAETASPFL